MKEGQMDLGQSQDLERIKYLLDDVLKELKFHGKLLSSMVEMMDARKFEQGEAKRDIEVRMNKIATDLEGSPFAPILKEVAKTLGGKHGS
jgi:hypothetical protein